MDLYQIIAIHGRPWSSLEIILFLIIFGVALCTVSLLVRKRRIRCRQAVAAMLLLVFLAVVFGTTVFTRTPGRREYQLELFWSWKEILGIGESGRLGNMGQRSILLQENLLNMLLLFPMGLLLPVLFDRKVLWWQGFLAGAAVSFSIEILQLILCRGLFEWDDMIHNGLGCMIGAVVVSRLPRG